MKSCRLSRRSCDIDNTAVNKIDTVLKLQGRIYQLIFTFQPVKDDKNFICRQRNCSYFLLASRPVWIGISLSPWDPLVSERNQIINSAPAFAAKAAERDAEFTKSEITVVPKNYHIVSLLTQNDTYPSLTLLYSALFSFLLRFQNVQNRMYIKCQCLYLNKVKLYLQLLIRIVESANLSIIVLFGGNPTDYSWHWNSPLERSTL